MKRGKLIIFLSSIFLVPLISAETVVTSLRELILYMDPETVQIVVVFLVAFTLLYWVLKKYFKKNKRAAGIVAFCLSFGITYWMVWQDRYFDLWQFNLDFFDPREIIWELEYYTGLSIQTIAVILVIIVIGALLLKRKKPKPAAPAATPTPA